MSQRCPGGRRRWMEYSRDQIAKDSERLLLKLQRAQAILLFSQDNTPISYVSMFAASNELTRTFLHLVFKFLGKWNHVRSKPELG
jgi:hemolysin-activating ACP:hemolysin acyltransferase